MLLASGLFVRDLPPPADVVMETLRLFWVSLSLSLSCTHAYTHSHARTHAQCSIRMLMLYSTLEQHSSGFPCDLHNAVMEGGSHSLYRNDTVSNYGQCCSQICPFAWYRCKPLNLMGSAWMYEHGCVWNLENLLCNAFQWYICEERIPSTCCSQTYQSSTDWEMKKASVCFLCHSHFTSKQKKEKFLAVTKANKPCAH